jgi:hypothetical protein
MTWEEFQKLDSDDPRVQLSLTGLVDINDILKMSKVTAAQLLDKYWKKTKLEPDPIEPR